MRSKLLRICVVQTSAVPQELRHWSTSAPAEMESNETGEVCPSTAFVEYDKGSAWYVDAVTVLFQHPGEMVLFLCRYAGDGQANRAYGPGCNKDMYT